MNKSTGYVIFGAPILLIASLIVAIPVLFGGDDCGPGVDLQPQSAITQRDTVKVPGWNAEQLKNAAIIATVGKKLGVPPRGRVIAIMTAIGESSLIVVDRGDAAGPDSRGLFQQRNSWGSYADRMNPAKSAELFYRALVKVDGWDRLEPTQAAHRVQNNADPNHYERFWPDAVKIFGAVSGTDVDLTSTSIAPECLGDDLAASSYSSGADCDFGSYKAKLSCRDALVRAAVIRERSDCTSDLPGGNWYRWCLAFVARTYGLRFAGYATAMDMYRAMKGKGLISTSKKIPAGALVWFSASSPAGHVALYAGDGKAYSNDYIRRGCIDLTPMTTLSTGGGYLGWSPPAFPGA